eukprot:scaffold21632_cov62-Phaeocystis_antarctica.AAC.12
MAGLCAPWHRRAAHRRGVHGIPRAAPSCAPRPPETRAAAIAHRWTAPSCSHSRRCWRWR